MTLFHKILIANRGEIACRIIKTCQRLGIKTVAIGSMADRSAMHMHMADEAVVIGPAEVRDSYLNSEAIIRTALEKGAQAIHPGYGFLSENADFAEAVVTAGLVFIGPSAEAIRIMGAKNEAKKLAYRLDVPVIPGYHGEDQTLDHLQKEALKIVYPIIIKAAYGGGGKGMRRVDRKEDFHEALTACQREAKGAFGSAAVILEKYLHKPRHIEIQIMGDKHGNCIALGERDCSVQRRHQKVLEEAPASDLPHELRVKMAEAAVRIGKGVHYEGAGTVEFLVATHENEFFIDETLTGDKSNFYFLEMNTRLQVEHPVTELVTELDLVEWQIRIAAGHFFPLKQKDVRIEGHAIEARLYAEDPERNFLPTTGQVTDLSFPEQSPTIRVDTGIQKGDHITIHYDPLLAKIVAWGKNRAAALQNLSMALYQTKVKGVRTNLQFLQTLVNREEIRTSPVDIGFLDRTLLQLTSTPLIPDEAFVLAALWLYKTREQQRETSPWSFSDGWRLNTSTSHPYKFEDDEGIKNIQVSKALEEYVVTCNSKTYPIEACHLSDSRIWGLIQGKSVYATISMIDDHIDVLMPDRPYHFRIPQDSEIRHKAPAPKPISHGAIFHLNAPMPGRIIAILAKTGQKVEQGYPFLTIEAMKMEHTIRTPFSGKVEKILYGVGDFVEEGAELATVVAHVEESETDLVES